ncbi:hypothetical protein MAPG_10778 [Magnaporthiopsis poae ATCC 64411]|uniref:Uncharacterized protein n=1 Tax=Magnaporthiopsis poae (strain ATCC 64411 / 73-15) TaxID=644358 RepID=A0A0C4EDH8_MAGP6|nr:hypothetical protein MAPG_10778 [Magnaporthiopsis poae ATCC 64411]
MCTSKFTQYTCGCKKVMDFVQREERQGSNVEWDPAVKEWGKESTNYCSETLG